MTNTHYRWNAEAYAVHSSAQHEWAKELIRKLTLRGNEILLDMGCGNGRISAEIARYLPQGAVLGIDSSQEMIDSAKTNFPQVHFPNLTFKKVDIHEMDFENQFDVVFSNATLHWIQDHLSVLCRVRKSMKESGKLLFQMGGKNNAEDILSVLNEMFVSEKWRIYFSNFDFPYGFYGPQEYTVWLDQAGLKAIRIELIPKDMKQKGQIGLAGWIRTTWLPYTERIPEKMKEEFISEVVDRYVSIHPPDRDGYVHVKMVRLEIEAKKSG